MLEKRGYAGVSVTQDDQVIVTGGWNGGGYMSSTEYINYGQWVQGSPLPVSVAYHCQATVGSRVVVTGKTC